ncbi:MAG: YidC/Oxa1 family membrane protein insertase, partial [Clostridia bacterium]|nr:YidC/Oxa1 family membrane protein insertase [Clostridia bacterium]
MNIFDYVTDILGIPLGYVMQFCHWLLSDYGLAIILFTLFTKIIILPIGIWVHKNSIKMVKIQPAINRVKAKFFGDSERIAEEQSKLFKEQKYRPMASLVPLAIQIILLLGVVAVIYHPFQYVFHTPQNVMDEITTIAVEEFEVDPESNYVEIGAIQAIKE